MDNPKRRYKERNIATGSRLREFRMQRGLSCTAVSEMFGITENDYRRIECGRVSLSIDKAEILHRLWGVDLNYLYTGDIGIPARVKALDTEEYINHCSIEDREEFLARMQAILEAATRCPEPPPSPSSP